MASNFITCVDNGGKVKTKKFDSGKYQRVCTIAGNVFYDKVRTRRADRKVRAK